MKWSELPQEEIICPYCNEIHFILFNQTAKVCSNCSGYFSIEVVKRPDLYITKPLGQ